MATESSLEFIMLLLKALNSLTTLSLFFEAVEVLVCVAIVIGYSFLLLYPFIAIFYLVVVPKAQEAWIATFNES